MTKLTAKCHCGLANFTYDLSASAFPLKSALCHCNSCRYVTGHLFARFAVIPDKRPDISKLTEYNSSSIISRYFCPKCGASICNFEKDEWEFATGILNTTSNLLSRAQLFIEDTRDGGAARWLTEAIPEMHPQHRDSKAMTASYVKAVDVIAPRPTQIHAECHCGNVSFDLAKGTYNAGLDACYECRTTSGPEITSWLTAPQESIAMADGAKLSFEGMDHYESTPGCNRYFCRTCGAAIFWRKDGRETIDIGVGLLRGSGARVKEALQWEKYEDCVQYQRDAMDPEFVQALAKSIQTDRNSGHL